MTAETPQKETMAGMIEVLDPSGRANPVPVEMAERVGELKGKTIGFFNNGKPNADVMLARLREVLAERFQPLETITRQKTRTGGAADGWLMDELVQKCDAVIISQAD